MSELWSFLRTYSYLASSLLLLISFFTLLLFYPGNKKPAVLSAYLCTPFSLSSIFLVHEYWNPVFILRIFPGVEDLLFSFSVGGIVWVFATWFHKKKLSVSLQPALILKRYLIFSVLGVVISGGCSLSGLDAMSSALVATGLVGLIIIILKKSLYKFVFLGIFPFVVFYLFLVFVHYLSNPQMLFWWNPRAPWGTTVLGLPLGELAWAFCFSSVWPLYMAFLFKAEVRG